MSSHFQRQHRDFLKLHADFIYRRVKQLETEVLQVGNLLRTMEISEDKANQREDAVTTKITEMTAQLEEATAKAEKYETQAAELDRQQDELEGQKHFTIFDVRGPSSGLSFRL